MGNTKDNNPDENARKGVLPSSFYDAIDHSTLTGIQSNLKKNAQVQRRYLISVAFLPDTILAPVSLLEILVQQTNGMKLDPAEPGYASKVLLMREKARNLVFLAAIRKASAVVNLKEALGTKGAIQLNSATRIATKLAQAALTTVDNYFNVNFSEIIRSDEKFHVGPHLTVTLHKDIPASKLNVYGQFNDVVQTVIKDKFPAKLMEGESAKAITLRKQRALFEREVFIISRIISATNNNTIRPRLVLNISKEADSHYVTVKPKHTSFAGFTAAVADDNSVGNILHLDEHDLTIEDAKIPDFNDKDFHEWKVKTITLAEIAILVKNGLIAKLCGHKLIDVNMFGIAPFVEGDGIEFADIAVNFSDSSLYRHLTPGAAFAVKDMYSDQNFTDERFETCKMLFGDTYKFRLITHNDIRHFVKGNNFLPDSARNLVNRLNATNVLNVTFINVQDTLIKADANGDTLNTMEIGDQHQIERALMEHNERNDFSLEYITVFADLINKYGSPSQDHVADTSIPSDIAKALRNDEMTMASFRPQIAINKEVSVVMQTVMRNNKGMAMKIPNLNEHQLKSDDGRIQLSIVGDYTNPGTEVLERNNRDQLELLTAHANYMDGEDTYDSKDTFVNHPKMVIDHNSMNTTTVDMNMHPENLHINYDEFVNGICYGPTYNDNLNSSISMSQLVTGSNVGNLPNTAVYSVKTGAHTLTIMAGLSINASHIDIGFNHYKLYEGNGEVETLYFSHVGVQHKKRIAIVLNQYIAKKTIHIRRLEDEYVVKLKVKTNYKLQDFMNIKYFKNFDMTNLIMNNSYNLAGLDYGRRVELAQDYNSLSITKEYYKYLKEFALKIVLELSVLQCFFRLFTNLEIYEYSQNDLLSAHITLYKGKFMSLEEKEKVIVHDIIFATITALVASYDKKVLPNLEILSDKKIAGTITEAERITYARTIAEHPVACWTSKVSRSYSVPDQIRNIYTEIAQGGSDV